MSFGVVLPISFVLAELIAYEAGVLMPHLPAVGLLLTGIIFSVAVLRLKLFLIEPVKEDKLDAHSGKDPGIKLVSGHCDLIKSKKADLSYRMFVAEVAAGNKGLLITRVHPDQVREKYGLVKTPILWLSGQPGPDRMDPASLSILQHTVVDFLQKGSTSVILLDGLEYLVSENQVDKVLRFIYTVHDAVVISGSKFIVPVDPDILGTKDMALFEKEFVVIEEQE
jgi:two-component system cell cycle response regulator